MDVTTYILLSREQALRRQVDVGANNMANSNTTGFRREEPVFREYVGDVASEGPVRGARPSFVLDYGSRLDLSHGIFQSTGSEIDIMVEGEGWLNVQSPSGETAYTRAGHLTVLASGELATVAGQKLLDEAGRPITVPPDQRESLEVTNDGTVTGSQGPLGRIAVTVFADSSSLTPRGDGLVTGQGGRILTAAETRLRNGGVEGSNVQPIAETTRLVETLRAYQSSRQIGQDLDEMRRRTIERLSRNGS
jgi:flagellar basal-body rod protein FlgF